MNQQAPAGKLVLRGQVVDGTLNAPLPDGVVVIDGAKIAWVGPAQLLPDQYRTP